jgi:PAS domain S-box-containing protein
MEEMFSRWFGGTERNQLEALKAILYEMTDGVIVADKDGHFLLWNPAAERMVGLGMQEIPPENWSVTYGCFHEDGSRYKSDELPLVKAIKKGAISFEEIMLIKNENRPEGVWLAVTGTPILSGGGMVMLRDITQYRKQVADAQRLVGELKSLVGKQREILEKL